MATRAIEHTFTGATTPYNAYDSTKTVLGDLIKQYTGSGAEDKYAGPLRTGRDSGLTATYALARPNETSTAVPGIYPHVVRWANKTGYYSTGTVAVSGTAVTGTTTAWLTTGAVPIGARIGFGSTNPASITTWYTITALTSDTALTLQSSAGTVAGGTAFVIDKTYNIDWVFLADNAAAAATRRITLFTFNRQDSTFTWRGFITLTYPAGGGNQTIRGLRCAYATYTTGTVGVSGATVTGSGSTWSSDRIAIGSRIGFGSTDPTQIATWYYINAVGSDTSLTLQTNITASGTGGTAANITVSSSTPYVIEDLRVLTSTTAVVTGCGGLTAASGIAFDDFTIGGTTIAAATTTDKLKAVYSLVDTFAALYNTGTCSTSGSSTTLTGSGTAWAAASHLGCMIGFGSTNPASITTWYTITAVASGTSLTLSSAATVSASTAYVIQGANRTAAGLALDDRDSWTQQYCYILDAQTATTPSVFKYNIRASLASLGGVAQGKAAGGFVLATNTQAVTGSTSQTNNGRVGTLSHGPGSGVKSLYFATTTRIVRAAIAGITASANSWVSDAMLEVPTGGTSTYTASGQMTAVEIADQIDRLIITNNGTGTATTCNRSYVTQYNTNSTPFDLPFLIDSRQIDQSIEDSNAVPHPTQAGAALNVWSEGGLAYLSRTGTASTTNLMYAVPIGADWDFAGGTVKQRLITPALSTTNATKLKRVLVTNENYLGAGGLRIPMESYRVYYRTSGISDDSGSWTLIDSTGDLSAATAGSQVQFMFEFRTIGTFCIPARIYGLCCIYEDNTTDSHFQPSVAQSSTSSSRFAWRFSTAFGSTVPTLRVQLFDAVSGGSLVDDNTASPSGTFEKSTDGGSNWVAYNTTDKGNDTTYIRYTPASLGSNIKVRALLTQL